MIPPESELVEKYDVSSITIRQALEMLEQDGLIYRQRGRGTFVAHPTLEQNLTRITSFSEDMNARGVEPGTVMLQASLVSASDEIASILKVEPGEDLACFKRLRLADSETMSMEESLLVHRFCKGILKFDFANQSLRLTLEREFDVRLVHAKQTIRALAAQPDLAHLLSIKPGAPLLYIERISYSQDDLPMEFLRIYYRGDRYILYNDLQG
jgi:GntR family transcriptional regulator